MPGGSAFKGSTSGPLIGWPGSPWYCNLQFVCALDISPRLEAELQRELHLARVSNYAENLTEGGGCQNWDG